MKKTGRRSRKSRNEATPPRDLDDNQAEFQKATPNHEEVVTEFNQESLLLKSSEKLAELEGNDSYLSPKSKNPASNDGDSFDLRTLQEQVTNLKNKVDREYALSMQKARNTYDDPIRLLKAQKVQLLCKMKMDAVQFRLTKATLEKENLQLKKQQRKDQFEMRKLMALTQRQKLVLRRKTEEASLAFKRLNSVLQMSKNNMIDSSGSQNENGSARSIESELKHSLKVEEIRSEYERQMEEMQEELLKYEEEAEMLRDENFRLMIEMKQMESLADACELKELKAQVGEISDIVGAIAVQALEKSNPEMEKEREKEEESSSRKCCSCSKKSLCKTQKCECLAAGGLCGFDCGCSSSKCSNRGHQKDGSAIRQPFVEVGNTKSQLSVKKLKRTSRK